MIRKNPISTILLCLLSSLLFLSACSNSDASNAETKAAKKEEDKFEKLAEEKNKELELESIELTSYSEEVGVTLKEPHIRSLPQTASWLLKGRLKSIQH